MLMDGRKEGSEGRMVSEVKEPRQSSYATLDMTLNGRLEKMPLHPMAQHSSHQTCKLFELRLCNHSSETTVCLMHSSGDLDALQQDKHASSTSALQTTSINQSIHTSSQNTNQYTSHSIYPCIIKHAIATAASAISLRACLFLAARLFFLQQPH
jgi:hypothetical protein